MFKKNNNKKMEEQLVKIKMRYAQYKKDILTIQDHIAKETEALHRIKQESAELIVIAEKAQKAENHEDRVLALQRVESNEEIIHAKIAFIHNANKTFSDIFAQLEILGNEINTIQNRTNEIEAREKMNTLRQTMKEELGLISANFNESLEQNEARLNAIDEVKKVFD